MKTVYFFIDEALNIAREYYDEKGYAHALRVADFVAQNPMIPSEKRDFCVSLAVMHDLCEDTDFPLSEIKNERMRDCLELITKEKSINYIEYCKHIKENAIKYPEVYWVKLFGDMKDHLSQVDTLTDKLKEKYLSALPHLL